MVVSSEPTKRSEGSPVFQGLPLAPTKTRRYHQTKCTPMWACVFEAQHPLQVSLKGTHQDRHHVWG